MRFSTRKLLRWGATAAVVALVVSTLATPRSQGMAASPESGMVCTSNPNATFTLTARDGYVNTPDGNSLYMWSFAAGSDPFQFPGPVLCVNQGDTVTVVLNNMLSKLAQPCPQRGNQL